MAPSDNAYLFSTGLVPQLRDKPIRAEQISRRWRHIKKRFGITADFYSLKHTYLDAIAAEAEERGEDGKVAAQKIAGHSTPVITMTYLHGEEEREHMRNKGRTIDMLTGK